MRRKNIDDTFVINDLHQILDIQHRLAVNNLFVQVLINPGNKLKTRSKAVSKVNKSASIILKTAVGLDEVCGFLDSRQGAMTRNGIPFQGIATLPWIQKTVQFTS